MRKALEKIKGVAPLSVIVFLFSFYLFDPTIETGLDPSYAIGLNYIFAHGISFGTDIIYTYGPLGFLCFPQDVGHNFLLGVVLVSLLRFIFIYSFLYLGSIVNKHLWWMHATLILLLCNWVYLDFALVGATSILVLIHSINRRNGIIILASALAIVALLIKSSFGLMCISIVCSYSIYHRVKHKRSEVISWVFASLVFSLSIIWFLIYFNVDGIYKYLLGTWQLSVGNSSAMVLEVKNNWGLILAFALSFFSIPFLTKNKEVRLLYFVSFLALYAAWKYAFSREENYHLKFFFDYLLLFSALFCLILREFKPRQIALLLLSLLLFHKSMDATGMYTLDEKISWSGIANFSDVVFNSTHILDDAKFRSEQNLKKKELPAEFLSRINNQTIDFFPWELSYVAANKLNWKPRPNMQSGAYTPWLDKNTANFISSKQAPEFYLWEMDKPNGGVACFDDRYLLNDEPHTIFSLFNNYQIVYFDSNNVLFQKADTHRFSMLIEGEKLAIQWNKWIKVPADSLGIIRLKATIKNNGIGALRKGFYKDIIYYLDYKFKDGSEKAVRIVRDNAVNGLWINPFLERISEGLSGKQVVDVRFRCSDEQLVTDTILFQWQIITLAQNQKASKDDE